MSRDIPERDWKVFRQIHPIARDRFCEDVLSKIGRASSASGQSAHHRYLKVFELLSDKDKQLAALFDKSNQSMKPTAPLRNNHSVFATTPCRGLSLSR